MVSKRVLILSGLTLLLCSLNADAQQQLPRPIVLYRPVTTTTVVPQAKVYTAAPLPLNQWNSPAAQPRAATIGAIPVSQQTTASKNPGMPSVVPSTQPNSGMLPTPGSNINVQQVQSAGNQPGQAGSQPLTPEQEWAAEQKRPTYQAMLNPSAPFNMTHTSMTSGQQYSPNTYLGTRFDNWTNQQQIEQSPSIYGELPRNQPPVQFGGYTGPNTFMGTGFDSWTNMSMGGITPGSTGSWDFSVWP